MRPRSHVLEVGCGDGSFTLLLRKRGHDAVGVDPAAPTADAFVQTEFKAFAAPARSFDAVVAGLSLHHIRDLDGTLDKIASLLNSDGVIIVRDYGWERMDEPTAQWYHAAWARTGYSAEKGAAPRTAEETLRNWRGELADLHTASDMRSALAARFDEREFCWQPYLARELRAPGLEPEERTAIERGEITPVGFFYCGALVDV